MTGERPAIVCGAMALTEAQLRERIAAAGTAGVDVPGRVIPIRDPNRVTSLLLSSDTTKKPTASGVSARPAWNGPNRSASCSVTA